MMIALLLTGFIMMTLGVALVFLGEVPFLGGKRIPAWRSRLIGFTQMSFLPLALVTWKGVQSFVSSEVVDWIVVTWSLFGFCWFVTFALLFRVMFPKRAPRSIKAKATAGSMDPFEDAAEEPAGPSFGFADPEPAPAKLPAKKTAPAKPASKPGVKRAPAPPAEDDNPFNFS